MFIVCWSAKGGVGTTTVASALGMSLGQASLDGPAIIVDLGGDVPAVLGVSDPSGPGLGEWLGSPTASADSLARIGTPVTDDLHVIGAGALGAPSGQQISDDGWERFGRACAHLGEERHVVVDAGPMMPAAAFHALADHSLLTARACYVVLRRSIPMALHATGIVLVAEPGHSMGTTDVERSLGRPVLAELPCDPAISQAIDAGLVNARVPHALVRPLRRFTSVAVGR